MRIQERTFLLGVLAVMLVASSLHAATYTWTGGEGAGSDWYHVNNWAGGSVPESSNQLRTTNAADVVIFDSETVTYMPSDTIYYGKAPQIQILNGTVNFSSTENWGWSGIDVVTVGDGNMTTLASASLQFFNLNRDPNGTKTYVVRSDGTLSFTGTIFKWSDAGAKLAVIRIIGGTVVVNGYIQESYLTDYANNYVSFEAAGSSLTADFGSSGQFQTLADVQANMGTGLSFRPGGASAEDMVLTAVDNDDGTFTIDCTTPLKVGLSDTSVQFSDPVGTVVGSMIMKEGGAEQSGYTFSIVPTNDYAAFGIDGTGTNLVTALAMTNEFYEITLRGTNTVEGTSADTAYTIDVVFPAVGYTNDWTGAEDADWLNAYNWSYRRVPPAPSFGWVGALSGGLIRFNAVGSANPLPTSNIPSLTDSSSGYRTPPIALLHGGTISFGGTSQNWGNTQTSTVGDGDVGNGTVTLNYTAMNYLNRDPNSVKTWVVNADGTLNFTASGPYDMSDGSLRPSVFIVNGGTVMLNGAMKEFVGTSTAYVEFTADGSFTASFGNDFVDVDAVNANIGPGLSFRYTTTRAPVATDNEDNTFTIEIPPPAGTIIIFR